jgi:hypothetical protein
MLFHCASPAIRSQSSARQVPSRRNEVCSWLLGSLKRRKLLLAAVFCVLESPPM